MFNGASGMIVPPEANGQVAKGMDMKQNKLRLTYFDVVPLKNVVGIRRAIAYQINVRRGPILASTISVPELTLFRAANDGRKEDRGSGWPSRFRALFRRLLER